MRFYQHFHQALILALFFFFSSSLQFHFDAEADVRWWKETKKFQEKEKERIVELSETASFDFSDFVFVTFSSPLTYF